MTREAPKDKYDREFVNKEALARYRRSPDRFANIEFTNASRDLKSLWEKFTPAGKRKAAKKGYQKLPSSVNKPKMRRLEKIKKYYGDKPAGYPRSTKGSVK
jgi:hypothetical protein